MSADRGELAGSLCAGTPVVQGAHRLSSPSRRDRTASEALTEIHLADRLSGGISKEVRGIRRQMESATE